MTKEQKTLTKMLKDQLAMVEQGCICSSHSNAGACLFCWFVEDHRHLVYNAEGAI